MHTTPVALDGRHKGVLERVLHARGGHGDAVLLTEEPAAGTEGGAIVHRRDDVLRDVVKDEGGGERRHLPRNSLERGEEEEEE